MSKKKTPLLLDFTDIPAVEALFDEAFRYPRRHYTVQPVDAEVAAAWLKENTYMVGFVWCAGVKSFEQRLKEAGPLRCGQLIGLDMLYYRGLCGWESGSYHCDYPNWPGDDADHCRDRTCGEEECEGQQQETGYGKRLCYSFNCPIASEADREDIRRLDPGLWQSDYKGNTHKPEDWMVLHSRPRYAYVPNVIVLGCESVK